MLIVQQLNVMGQPLYRKVEPTGYSLKNADWLNSATLLGRMNFALTLVSNRIPGNQGGSYSLSNATRNAVAHAPLLMTDLSENARKAIQMGVDNPEILQQVGNDRSQMQDVGMRAEAAGVWK